MRSMVLKSLVVMVALNMAVQPFGNTIAAVFGYFALILSAWLPIDLMRLSGNRCNKKQLVIVFAFLGLVILDLILTIYKLQLGNLENIIKSLISFFSFMFALSMGGIEYFERDLEFYFKVARIFSFLLVAYTVIPFGFRYTVANKYGYMQFTLSMGNPNATASKVLFFLLLLVVQIGITKSKKGRNLNWLLVSGLLYTLLKLESRTAMACALFGVFLGLIIQYRMTKRVANIIWLVPVLFIPIQIFLGNSVFTIFGKSLATGRNELFSGFLSSILVEPSRFLAGDFFSYCLENQHNIVFSLLFNFGFVGLFLYYFFWGIEIKRLESNSEKIANMAWIAIMAFVIQSMSESASMSGAFTYGSGIILFNRLTKDCLLRNAETEAKYDLITHTRTRANRRRKHEQASAD